MTNDEKILQLGFEVGELIRKRSVELDLNPVDSIQAVTGVCFALLMAQSKEGMQAHSALMFVTIINSYVEKFLDMEAEKHGESSV